jgi:hypothetical protein
MDNQRHGIRASGEYATYGGREYFAHSFRDRVRLLSDDDPLPPGFTASTKSWVRGETIVQRTDVARLDKIRTVARWCGYRFEVGIIIGDTANVTYLGARFDEVCGMPGMHRPDKYEVIGEIPVSELTDVEEHVALRGSDSAIAAALWATMRKGDGLTVPYQRRWEVGGCEPNRSLRSYPYDGVRVLATGLKDLERPMFTAPDRIIVEYWARSCWVAVDRSTRGVGPPDAFLVGMEEEGTGRYVGNAAEVVVEMVREALGQSTRTQPAEADVQIGFPGLHNTTTTYVGSWQWNVHGEVSEEDLAVRAAQATLRAIAAKKETDEQQVRSDFATEVERTVGAVLSDNGLVLDEIFDGLDDGASGRPLTIVYYRGRDCRLQIYRSSREGETNCMIAPLDAPNEYGLRSRSKSWQFLTRSVPHPELPLEDLARTARREYDSHETPLHWVRTIIEKHFDAAHAGMLERSATPPRVLKIDVSEALTLHLKHYPGRNDAEFLARYGAEQAPVAEQVVRNLLAEAITVQPDWTRMSLDDAGDHVQAVMHARHPELTAEALASIGNYYTYLMR